MQAQVALVAGEHAWLQYPLATLATRHYTSLKLVTTLNVRHNQFIHSGAPFNILYSTKSATPELTSTSFHRAPRRNTNQQFLLTSSNSRASQPRSQGPEIEVACFPDPRYTRSAGKPGEEIVQKLSKYSVTKWMVDVCHVGGTGKTER